MLLVFALKLGAAAACAKHDLAVFDPGGAGHVAVAASEQGPSSPGQPPAHGGSCTHCECHHSATIPSQPAIALVAQVPTIVNTWTAPIPFAEVRQDLRPPIA